MSGTDDKGPLAERRLAEGKPLGRTINSPSPLDGAIASNIDQHLRGSSFSYTLDITDAKTRAETEPLVWFLSKDGHRGHCEYFAGAMALMCQSLGIEARVVAGFRCEEYNGTPGAGYYIVRQSQAHTWVEVLTPEGWQTFDPTNGREGGAPGSADAANPTGLRGAWLSVEHFFDFMEHAYAEKVVAYDNDSRDSLLQAVEDRMSFRGLGDSGGRTVPGESPWSLSTAGINHLFASALGLLLVGGGAAVVIGVTLFIVRRARLRRRAERIGIDSLPTPLQLRLARQLAFYDELIQLLGRHQIVRPPHLTAMEFTDTVGASPGVTSDTGEAIRRLTGVYYRVRYGHADLSPGLQRRLSTVVTRIDAAFTAATTPAAQ